MEIVREEDLKRYAVIDLWDIIAYESDNVDECLSFFEDFGGHSVFHGVYDYQEYKYINEESAI